MDENQDEPLYPIVVCFLDSGKTKCSEHGEQCNSIVCFSRVMNTWVKRVSDSPITHCELYFPDLRQSWTVDARTPVAPKLDRTYITDSEARYWFVKIYVSNSARGQCLLYLQSQVHKGYNGSEVLNIFGQWVMFGCINKPPTLEDRFSKPYMGEQSEGQTCALLVASALIHAGVLQPFDARAITPAEVYDLVLRIPGHELTNVLPRMDPVVDASYEKSIQLTFAPGGHMDQYYYAQSRTAGGAGFTFTTAPPKAPSVMHVPRATVCITSPCGAASFPGGIDQL